MSLEIVIRSTRLLLLLARASPAVVSPAAGSTPAAADQAARACLSASSLRGAALAGGPLMFRDMMGKTAVLVTGRWKPAHMKRARATMLCPYDRRTRKAETVGSAGWTTPAR